MFIRLFAESGLSLERLRALVEVGACGSIVRAADNDPVRQSLYSRQIKELEDFFQIRLVERQGKGVRLTGRGRELARISRFFLLGLSNFQRGCLAEDQTYRIGAGPTFISELLMPALACLGRSQPGLRFAVDVAGEEEIERRLHDLTLDFGIINRRALSRPLQVRMLGRWQLTLWAPRSLAKTPSQALAAFNAKTLPLVWPEGEISLAQYGVLEGYEPTLVCGSYVDARAAAAAGAGATFLPEFLSAAGLSLVPVALPDGSAWEREYGLAWNPRLLRLNPHAARRRDALIDLLTKELKAAAHVESSSGSHPGDGSRKRR